MAYAVVLDSVPDSITQGESVSWKVSYADYPASTWTISYALVNASGQETITGTADGDAHLIEIPAATSAAYTAGDYDWQAYVTDGTERAQVASGIITIVVDFATQTSGYDSRSHVKITLDALEASIENRASKTQLEQKVDGVQVKHMELADMVMLRDKYRKKYYQELVAAGKVSAQNTIYPRFTT